MRWRALVHSTTARFILLAFGMQLLVTIGVLLFVQQASEHALAAEQRQLVHELTDELNEAWRDGGAGELREMIRMRLEATHGAVAVILYAKPDGTPIVGNLEAWPTVVAPKTTWRAIDLYRTGSDEPERMGIMANRLPNGDRLLAGHVIESNLQLARVNKEAILAALMAGMALALLGALIIGRLLSRRIEAIASTANAVGEGMLTERVRADGSGDAFDMLGTSINAMLDRIEALVSQLRMITDGLAHDLRSPLTRMKSLIERSIADTRDTATLPALERISQEADILLKMLSTALQISRAEAGIGRDRFSPVDIAALLEDLVEIYGPLAEEEGFEMKANAPSGLQAFLHRELVSQALGNLIENALKYAEGGTCIALCGKEDGSTLVLEVADNGPGISPEHREEAMKRFGRLDPARHIAGSGLGLSLAEAVATLHDGRIVMADNGPGLIVRLCFANPSHG